MLHSCDGFVKTLVHRLYLSLLIIFLPSLLFGQKEPQQPKLGVRVNLVSLDLEALDRKGNQILGLTRSDFVVEENGKPMEITNFALSTDRPISLAAVLDTSTLSTRQLGICKEFLLIFAHKLDHTDEICLYSFDERNAYLEQDLTTDRPLLMSALENIGVPSKKSPGVLIELFGADPRTGLAIDRALLKLREAHNSKRVLLLISNRFRGLGPATVEHVQLSGCTLTTLAFPHKSTMIVSLGGDEISSRQLMRESGGRRFSAGAEDIGQVCQKVTDSLKNYYSIGYLTEIKAGDKKPRKIRVRVPGRKCAVHFRRTYIPT
jgi:VWFA-related protein